MNDSAPHHVAALGLLRSLSGEHGIRASASSEANYANVFARDAVMAGVGGLLVRDDVVTDGLRATLAHLRDLQGPEGQIASNYLMREGHEPRVSFGTLVPRVDAALWYVIGVGLAARAGAMEVGQHRAAVAKVMSLLAAIEYNGRHLLYGVVGGNWADEYVYDGYVLHDQVLRAWGLRLAGDAFAHGPWREKGEQIEETISAAFWPVSDTGRRHPLAAFSPARVHDMFDLATTALLGASGIAPSLGDRALRFVAEDYLARSALPPVFHPVIDATHSDWPALARYHLHGFRNQPHEYHNGGIWPIWLGWLALALGRTSRGEDLATLRGLVAAHLAAQHTFDFHEFFHGLTGAPAGMPHMAYSATGLLFLDVAGDVEPALFRR